MTDLVGGGIIGGVDTHLDTHVAAALSATGALLGIDSFPASAAGYQQLLDWLTGYGAVDAVGVEGTGSYGAGLARHLTAAAVTVYEVDRPNRADRRRRGKSDPIDAENAARAVLAGTCRTVPKDGTGPVEAIRMLKTTRDGAVKAKTAAINQLHALVVTAPAALRSCLQPLSSKTLIERCAALRPAAGETMPDVTTTAKRTLKTLARRIQYLQSEIDDLDTHLATLVAATAPTTLAEPGVGIQTAAQLLITCGDNPERLRSEASFARLCGTAPIPVSSGRTDRHRLHRGGDRQANSALHMICLTRQAHHHETKAYRQRRETTHFNGRYITRCLKRALARRLYHTLLHDLTTLPTRLDKS
jgi:transposase